MAMGSRHACTAVAEADSRCIMKETASLRQCVRVASYNRCYNDAVDDRKVDPST